MPMHVTFSLCESRASWVGGQICQLCKGHAGDHSDGKAWWAPAPHASQAPSPMYQHAVLHMTNVPFGGPPWPERKTGKAPELGMGFEPRKLDEEQWAL